MSDDCENLKYNFLECIRNVHVYSNVKDCFEYWDGLIKCVNTDIKGIKEINMNVKSTFHDKIKN